MWSVCYVHERVPSHYTRQLYGRGLFGMSDVQVHVKERARTQKLLHSSSEPSLPSPSPSISSSC